MSLAEKILLTTDEYLQGEESAEFKHEYQNGDVLAMVGATDNHVTVAGNLFILLKQHLKNTPCRTYISDMKLRVDKANAFFYPDVFVTCNPKDRDNALYKEQAIFVAEVLSPSTEAFDRGNKFNAYRQLDSLQTYWLINSQTQQVDSFVRTENNDWLLHSYDQPDSLVEITSLDTRFLLKALYEDTLL